MTLHAFGESAFPGNGSGGLALLDVGSTEQTLRVSVASDFFEQHFKLYMLYEDANNFICWQPDADDPDNTDPGYFLGLRIRSAGVDYWITSESWGALHGGNHYIEASVNAATGSVYLSMTTDGGGGASGSFFVDLPSRGIPVPTGTSIGWDFSGGTAVAQSNWPGFSTPFGTTGPGTFLATGKVPGPATCTVAVTYSTSHIHLEVSDVVGDGGPYQIAFYEGGQSDPPPSEDALGYYQAFVNVVDGAATIDWNDPHGYGTDYHDLPFSIRIYDHSDTDAGYYAGFGPARTFHRPLPSPTGVPAPTSGTAPKYVTMTASDYAGTDWTGPATGFRFLWNDDNPAYEFPNTFGPVDDNTHLFLNASVASVAPYYEVEYADSGYMRFVQPFIDVVILSSLPNLAASPGATDARFIPAGG